MLPKLKPLIAPAATSRLGWAGSRNETVTSTGRTQLEKTPAFAPLTNTQRTPRASRQKPHPLGTARLPMRAFDDWH
jgi:hypothetical protein